MTEKPRAQRRRSVDDESERREDDHRFTTSLAGLAVALLLIVIGLYVVEGLAEQSKLEDCVLQGRANCLRVDLTPLR